MKSKRQEVRDKRCKDRRLPKSTWMKPWWNRCEAVNYPWRPGFGNVCDPLGCFKTAVAETPKGILGFSFQRTLFAGWLVDLTKYLAPNTSYELRFYGLSAWKYQHQAAIFQKSPLLKVAAFSRVPIQQKSLLRRPRENRKEVCAGSLCETVETWPRSGRFLRFFVRRDSGWRPRGWFKPPWSLDGCSRIDDVVWSERRCACFVCKPFATLELYIYIF